MYTKAYLSLLLAFHLAVPVFVFQKEGVRSGGFQFPHLSIDILFGFVGEISCHMFIYNSS